MGNGKTELHTREVRKLVAGEERLTSAAAYTNKDPGSTRMCI